MTRTAHGIPLREEITKWECSSASDVKGKGPVSAGSFLMEKKSFYPVPLSLSVE